MMLCVSFLQCDMCLRHTRSKTTIMQNACDECATCKRVSNDSVRTQESDENKSNSHALSQRSVVTCRVVADDADDSDNGRGCRVDVSVTTL